MNQAAMHASHPSYRYRPAASLTTLMLMLMSVSALSACSPSAAPHSSALSPADRASELAAATGAPLTAGSPWLLMRDSRSGDAVWPSGKSFVLLHTVDGWRHLTNITPSAVPTDGGLAIATSSREMIVAVLPFDRLVVSPVLTRTGTGGIWNADELPGGLRPSRGAVALGPGGSGVTAILGTGGGTVVQKGPHGWVTLTSASRLMPGGHLRLDNISWAPDGRRGWLTGHGPASSPVAFTTSDSGRTWAPVPGLASDGVAALTPCRAGRTWMLPVVHARGTVSIATSADDGATWATGAALRVPRGVPAWGCHGAQLWLLGGSANGDHVYSSANSGATWSDRGLAPAAVTDLVPTGGDAGFATTTTAAGAFLWQVHGDGAVFSRVTLPGWLATIAEMKMPMN